MKKQKLLTIFFTVIFITVFSIFNFSEYKDFHTNKKNISEKQIKIKNNIKNFELNDIKNLQQTQIYSTPSKSLLEEIVKLINEAKKEIYLETYIFTEKRIQSALIDAYKKWIKIKIILEKSPYMAYNINNKTYNKLKKTWIDIVWSNSDNYSFNHSKILLIDDLSIISTGNFSYSTFTKNRDFFIFTNDNKINSKLKENFSNDYNWIKINIFDENLIFSPKTWRIKFEKLLNWAKNSIKIYFQYLKDDEFVNQLIKLKKEKNLDIKIIIPKTAKNDKNIVKLKNTWANIKVYEKYKIHSKAILIDENYLFIWSINCSNYSLDKNREAWILLINENIINKFVTIFNNDFLK
jgi:cardiolipin synthase A/B